MSRTEAYLQLKVSLNHIRRDMRRWNELDKHSQLWEAMIFKLRLAGSPIKLTEDVEESLADGMRYCEIIIRIGHNIFR